MHASSLKNSALLSLRSNHGYGMDTCLRGVSPYGISRIMVMVIRL